MASSNRHWPSMFKSKPCSAAHPHHQWQHDILSGPCTQRPASLSSGLGAAGEERSPEPKPRWNPRPEQIRILETIFNSGMVNPPRDEIRKIRVQLQEYGQVGDANVFYWFQNRKSRSKHKQRHQLQQSAGAAARGPHQRAAAAANSSAAAPPPAAPPPFAIGPAALAAATSSSSSSSERSTGSDRVLPLVSVGFTNILEAPPTAASPTASVNQGYFQTPITDFFVEPVYLPGSSQGFCLPTMGELSSVVGLQEPTAIGPMPGLWTELMMGSQQYGDKSTSTGGVVDVSNKSSTAKVQNPNPNPSVAAAANFGGLVNEIQVAEIGGGTGAGAARSTVFINGVGFEVVAGPFNVRAMFGEEGVLIHASGHPVLTDEWGITLHPLQQGASYFLI